MTTAEAYLALNLLPMVGPVRVRKMLAVLGTPQGILTAPRDKLLRIEGIGPELATQIANWEQKIDLAEELRLVRETGVAIVSPECPGYPDPLRHIYDPPLLLYVRGKLTKADERAMSIVGSRRATHYGLQAAKKLSFQLARAGFTIISGLARGIDTAAHEGALASGGRTIAVIGAGLMRLYPPENEPLANKIVESDSGAVVSEFPLHYPPDKQSFPLRNRIVSGWSAGLLVVEAPLRSGSLITAGQALDQGKNLYSVPGPIDRPSSAGCNRLIQQGAKLVMSAEDILEDYGAVQEELPLTDSAPRVELNAEEAALLPLLSSTETGIEDLTERSGLAPAVIAATLMRMEMRRLVKQLPGRNYVRLG